MTGTRAPGEGRARSVDASRRSHGRWRERGFGGVLLLVLLVGAAAGAALFAFSRSDVLPAQQQRKASDALSTAKAALVGYALGRGVVRCSNPSNTTQCAQEE